MVKVGKMTAALVLLAVGGLLLADRSMGTNYLGYLLDWWPVALILLGIEYLWANYRYRDGERLMKLDVSGLLIAVLISAVVVGVTQGSWLPAKLFDKFPFNWNSIVSGEFGHKFEKEPVRVPLGAGTEKIVIENPNGSVVLQAGTSDAVEVAATVWVDRLNEEEAKRIADQSEIVAEEDGALRIAAKGQEYGTWRKPRINLVVTVPERQRVDFELKLRNGKVEAAKLPVKNELRIETSNGSVTVSDIPGKLIANTTNGTIKASSIRGMADLGTTNGTISVADVAGEAVVKTTNAAVQAERIEGKLDASTKNGGITVTEAKGEIRAKTTNGAVTVSSHTVGGDWELETTNGRIEARVPENGSFEVEGEGRSASTNLPLDVSDNTVRGRIGSGQYKIRMETSNGAISVHRID